MARARASVSMRASPYGGASDGDHHRGMGLVSYVVLVALGLAAALGTAVAAMRASSSPQDGVAHQVTLGVLAILLLAVTIGCGFLVWFLYQFDHNFTF